MAAHYAAENAISPYNAFYERSETMALLGNLAGLRALEVGCGPGILTNWLVEQGALVTAMDVSPAMLGLARQSVGDRADLVLADLAAPLPFETASFDIVVASLVLHYVRLDRCTTGTQARARTTGRERVLHPPPDHGLDVGHAQAT
jgi:ubiquinone/menaquinone biosynthesis C-methylase UbiE